MRAIRAWFQIRIERAVEIALERGRQQAVGAGVGGGIVLNPDVGSQFELCCLAVLQIGQRHVDVGQPGHIAAAVGGMGLAVSLIVTPTIATLLTSSPAYAEAGLVTALPSFADLA